VAALAGAIARRVGEQRYRLWFDRRVRFRQEGGDLVVGVPNRHFEEWLEKTFSGAVADAAEEVYGQPLGVRFVIDPGLFQASRREEEAVQQTLAPPGAARGTAPAERPASAKRKQDRGSSAPPHALNERVGSEEKTAPRRARRWRRMADFVVGPCNRVAHAAALSVIESPGECANPLVLYGPVGTGKTHLLEGIYAGVRRAHPDWRVTYLTSEEMTNRFIQAMRHDRLFSFRKQLRDCDVLLLDDLQFLATKKATREELLHTFDALLADGRQLVLTCDSHPRLADDLGPELIDRLLGGAIWGLSPPDADTRLALLRAKAAAAPGPEVPDAVLAYLASQLRGNVRELEGAVQSVRHYSRVTGRPIDQPLVREALADLLRHAVRVVQLGDVDRAVCEVLRMAPGSLQNKARAWAISHPRMVAMFLARKHTASSYGDIGAHFGGRNHSTVVAAEKKVRGWLAEDEELSLGERRVRVRELVERVERDLLR
jgi:chromosomal replication initiator protein